MSPQLGTFGAWFNPSYDDDTRVRFVAEAEALGFGTAWLGLGRRMLPDLTLVERALDATTTIVVATPAYVIRFDGARVLAADYHLVWLDSLADDVTIEGSAMNGVAHGAEAVRTIVTSIRALYDSQEFNFAGPYGENGFLEDYTAWVRGGGQIGNVVLVTRNAAGQAQHIVANYRPRTTLLLLSRLIGEQLAGTPYAEHFATSAPE